jgi:hypothetical protein
MVIQATNIEVCISCQMRSSPLTKQVLDTRILRDFIAIKMNLDNYNGLINPRDHVKKNT